MKHRSPLITLAAVAVAFAIMFIVNMLATPPGNSSTGTASPPASPSSTATESDDDTFPEEVVCAGRAEDNAGAVAVAVLGDQAAAYFCDGRNVESWYRGPVEGTDIPLTSKSDATLEARLDGDHIEGSVQINDNTVKAAYYTDLNGTWTVDQANGSELELFANVTNLFDRAPPIRGTFSDFTGSIQAVPALHDLLGRRYTAGARLRF